MKAIATAPLRAAVALFRVIRNVVLRRPVLVSPEQAKRRESICGGCPHRADDMCRLCACFISVKCSLSSERCPDKPPRWR